MLISAYFPVIQGFLTSKLLFSGNQSYIEQWLEMTDPVCKLVGFLQRSRLASNCYFFTEGKNKVRASELPVCASCHLGQLGLLTHLASIVNFQGFLSLSWPRVEAATDVFQKVGVPNNFQYRCASSKTKCGLFFTWVGDCVFTDFRLHRASS